MRKPYALTLDDRGNILVAGPVHPDDFATVFVAKLDPAGNVLWQRWLSTSGVASSGDRDSLEPTAGERDSFEPLMLEGDRPTLVPAPPARRRMGLLVAAACAFTLGIAGAAVARERVEIAPSAAAAQASLASAIAPVAAAPPPVRSAVMSDIPDAAPSASELRAEALALLDAREPAKAEIAAELLVRAAPDDALGYLVLGAAMQDQGKHEAARQAFSRCAKSATRGNVYECRALGGR